MKRRTVIAAGTGLAAAGVLGKTGLDAVKKESTMIALRKAEDRFHSNFGWLDSHHTFSFGDHHDPAHMGFRSLRVINDDQVAAGQGFGTHGHRDMEIVSYVLSGAIEHKDSMGNGSIIKPGRHAWVHVARGELTLNGQPMRSGDGAAVSDEGALTLKASGPSEVLVFDLA